MTIHYHGTPLTPRRELLKMAGKNFCVSFAAPADGDWCMASGQSVMWDNGAFSHFRKGGQLDVAAYYKWLEVRLHHPHWAVIPDVIDGSEADQRSLIATWPFLKELGAPVWHCGLSMEWLVELAHNWPRICFGSSGRYWQVGSPDWCRRIDKAFNLLEQAGLRPWVHMLRGMAMTGDRWPFASVDSVNVARNFKDTNTCPERMARRIDAIQCPGRWHLMEEQKEFAI